VDYYFPSSLEKVKLESLYKGPHARLYMTLLVVTNICIDPMTLRTNYMHPILLANSRLCNYDEDWFNFREFISDCGRKQ